MRRFRATRWVAIAVAVGVLPVLGAGCGGNGSSVRSRGAGRGVAMRLLLITDSTSSATAGGVAYGEWVDTLRREGVPFDSLVRSDASPGRAALPPLSDGSRVANYQGVVVATSGREGLSAAQWTQLQRFERTFGVRQLTAYAVPSRDYGLSVPSPAGGGYLPSTLNLTARGRATFPYLKNLAVTSGTWGYEAEPLAGASVETLISGPRHSSMLGIYTSSDGRQTMYQTFNQSPTVLENQLLRHGELAWLTRGTYFGDQRPMPQQQVAWSAASAGHLTGYISGTTVTVNNAGAPVEIPLTGTNIGSVYAGSQSGWVKAPSGISRYTALTAWPAPSAGPVALQTPVGGVPLTAPPQAVTPGAPSAPGLPGPAPLPRQPSTSISSAISQVGSVCIQIPPATVPLQAGRLATVYLKCKAAFQASSHCNGKLTLTSGGRRVSASFSILTRHVGAIKLKLPAGVVAGANGKASIVGNLTISTNQPSGPARVTAGALTVTLGQLH
jgi:hypothetical protein